MPVLSHLAPMLQWHHQQGRPCPDSSLMGSAQDKQGSRVPVCVAHICVPDWQLQFGI